MPQPSICHCKTELVATPVPAAGSIPQIPPRPRPLPQVMPLSLMTSRLPLPMATRPRHWTGWSKPCAPCRPSGTTIDGHLDQRVLPPTAPRQENVFPRLPRWTLCHPQHSSEYLKSRRPYPSKSTRLKALSVAAGRWMLPTHARFCRIRTCMKMKTTEEVSTADLRPAAAGAAASVPIASSNLLSKASSTAGPTTRISASTSDDRQRTWNLLATATVPC